MIYFGCRMIHSGCCMIQLILSPHIFVHNRLLSANNSLTSAWMDRLEVITEYIVVNFDLVWNCLYCDAIDFMDYFQCATNYKQPIITWQVYFIELLNAVCRKKISLKRSHFPHSDSRMRHVINFWLCSFDCLLKQRKKCLLISYRSPASSTKTLK